MDVITNRLIPKPKRVRVNGTTRVLPGGLTIHCVTGGAAREGAISLAASIEIQTGTAPAVETTLDRACEGASIVISTGDVDGGPQAYHIASNDKSLRLTGADDAGTFYATRTLKQALRFEDGEVLLPLLDVEDSPDLADRGFWDYFFPSPLRENSELYTFTTAEQWRDLIDDLSDYKLNLMELLVTDEGLCYNSPRFPELVQPGTPAGKNDLIREVMAHARLRAVRVLPSFTHPEHMKQVRKSYPETRAVEVRGCPPSIAGELFCFSQPETRRILGGMLEEVAELFSPDGLCVWIPEHMGHCTCTGCQNRFTYLREFIDICTTAAASIRKKLPGFRLRLLASFMRYSDEVIHMLPPGVELEYYECDRHGLYGFDSEKKIPQGVADRARKEHVVGCINYRGMGLKYVPLPYFDTVRGWVAALVQAGAHGISGSLYSNPGVCRWNLLAMVDAAWNLDGRTTDQFIRALLSSQSLADRDSGVEVLRALSRAWHLAHQSHPRLLDIHALTRIRDRRAMDYWDACYLTDALEDDVLPRFGACVGEVRAAIEASRSAGDEGLLRQGQTALAFLSYQFHVFSALHVYGRQQWPDPEKGPWDDWVEEITQHLRNARAHAARIPELSQHIRSRYPSVTADPPDEMTRPLGLLDELLSPAFADRLREAAWPDIQAFA